MGGGEADRSRGSPHDIPSSSKEKPKRPTGHSPETASSSLHLPRLWAQAHMPQPVHPFIFNSRRSIQMTRVKACAFARSGSSGFLGIMMHCANNNNNKKQFPVNALLLFISIVHTFCPSIKGNEKSLLLCREILSPVLIDPSLNAMIKNTEAHLFISLSLCSGCLLLLPAALHRTFLGMS